MPSIIFLTTMLVAFIDMSKVVVVSLGIIFLTHLTGCPITTLCNGFSSRTVRLVSFNAVILVILLRVMFSLVKFSTVIFSLISVMFVWFSRILVVLFISSSKV